jgi:hypothetical protein
MAQRAQNAQAMETETQDSTITITQAERELAQTQALEDQVRIAEDQVRIAQRQLAKYGKQPRTTRRSTSAPSERELVQTQALEDQVRIAQDQVHVAKRQLAKYGGRKQDDGKERTVVRRSTSAPATLPAPTASSATTPERKFGVFMVLDLEDGDPHEIQQIMTLVKGRKRKATADRDAEPKKKCANGCPPKIFVQSGNDKVLRALGIGVGPADKETGLATLTLPPGWSMYRRLEWMGTMGHAMVIKDSEDRVVCEISHQVYSQEVVVV